MARHIAGGELFYEVESRSANDVTYIVTLRLFRSCESLGPLLQNETVNVGIYDGNTRVNNLPMPLINGIQTITLNTAAFPCLVGNVSVCYQLGIWSAKITLPINTSGYTLARSNCCRIDGITNIGFGSSIGATYSTTIPGTAQLPTGTNSSPQFFIRDTALVCANKKFKLDFGATDKDNDSLSYTFCEAYGGATNNNSSPTVLNLQSLNYSAPFSGSQPLGSLVIIDPASGLINGVAPGAGSYVVNVCITEWRNGDRISQHRKDFILRVQSCDFIEADLPSKIINCNSFVVPFENGSTSSAITDYLWEFGDPLKTNDTSHLPTPSYTYTDTGRFKAILTVFGPKGCIGTDSTEVIVYPGFKPSFSVVGSCIKTPFSFKDLTTTKYGFVDSWTWNFGDPIDTKDTSTQQNPMYLFQNLGSFTSKLIVTSSKGCIDTTQQLINVSETPTIILPFKDTLICSIDTLPLKANVLGNFTWSPLYNIINPTSNNPLVYPKDTTTYYIAVDENGCKAIDSIKVNVLQFITVKAGLDTTICQTDIIQLKTISDALSYKWTSNTNVIIDPVKNPFVKPLVSTNYFVEANLGKCQDKDSISIKVVPYPISIVEADTALCFGSRKVINSTIVGSSFNWQPKSSLLNANTLTPTAGPSKTTVYILQVMDTLGCPKIVADSIEIKVVAPVKINAGKDTTVVINQPLQLLVTSNNDSNNIKYLWTPSLGLNSPTSANPIALYTNGSVDSILYAVKGTTPEGCFGTDNIVVKIFKTEPDIFVPTGFTPNSDGKNDILKPIPIGIVQFNYFTIYNRWGQILFTTKEIGKGWDGKFNGTEQPNGTYVFQTQGVDYTGKVIFRKGTTVLIK